MASRVSSGRAGFYLRLAWQGICKNGRVYLPYVVTCVGMVMMYYIVSALALSKNVGSMTGGGNIQMILEFGRHVIAFFALLFLVYTNTFLLRQRKREFGLYNVLGMSKLNLARVLLWESVLVAAIALAGGLALGLLFVKLAELALTRMLGDSARFVFDLAPAAIGASCVLFGVIFGLLLLNALRQVSMTRPVELLRAPSFGERPPKANWVMAALGLALLGLAYYMAVTIEDPLAAIMLFFVAVIMVIAATYLLFMAGSVALCRLLQKNKAYYYQTKHFVPTANMLFRMRRNGAGLASICILSTMVLVMLSTTLCLFWGKEAALRSTYPQDIIVRGYDAGNRGEQLPQFERVLAESGLAAENLQSYRYLGVAGFLEQDRCYFHRHVEDMSVFTNDQLRQFYFIPLEDYNQMTGQELELAEGELFVCGAQKGADYDFNRLTLPQGASDSKEFWVKQVLPATPATRYANNLGVENLFVVLPESAISPIYEAQEEVYEEFASQHMNWYWAFDLPGASKEEKLALTAELRLTRNNINERHTEEDDWHMASVECIEEERASFYSVFGGLFFLAILLGLVFVCGAVLIMYYKQLNEGYEDQASFGILRKVGMTDREIRRGISWQTLILFFAPIVLAGVHLIFAFNMLSKLLTLFGLTDMGLLMLIAAGCYLVFLLCYIILYWFTSRSYYKIVIGA